MTHNFETIEDKITNVLYKHHRYFYNNRAEDVEKCGDLKYTLYFRDNLVSEVGYDYDGYRYGEFETISNKDEFVKQLDTLDLQISVARELENVSEYDSQL